MQFTATPASGLVHSVFAETFDHGATVVDRRRPFKTALDLRSTLGPAASLLGTSILRLPVNAAANRPGVKRPVLLPWQIHRINQYIADHIGRCILVSDLSAILQRSEAHFARAFKRTLGICPHAYIIHCRLEKACRLMMGSDTPLSDIALACGLSDQAHLCKLFRQTTGLTPAAWRRTYRPEPEKAIASECTTVAA